MSNGTNTKQDMRKIFDVSPDFIRSSQIVTIRRPCRRSPHWAFEDEKIKKLLLKAFPKLATDADHRKKAGRWARIIQLYFRTRMSYRETAEEIGESVGVVHNIINRITRVSKNRSTRGGRRKKKVRDPIRAISGDRVKVL